MLDSKLSFGPYISQLVSRFFLQLRRIKSCVQALSMDVRKTVVNSFVISRVDYCNGLLAEVPRYQLDLLQSVMNTAARLIVGAKKQDHIKHVLWDRLHWLSVPQRVQFKLSADIQGTLWTGARPLSTSHNRRQQTETPIRHSWRPCCRLLCHAFWHLCICCGRS